MLTPQHLRMFGPAMARPRLREALRAAVGAGITLTICGLSLLSMGSAEGLAGFILIAPLGATAFLLFAVPNSPLAQPWSAIIGNTVSAIIAVAIVRQGLPLAYAAGLAVCLAMVAMALLRAMHPPGGAVALSTVLSAQLIESLGYSFVLAPVLLDTVMLVMAAILYNRLSGRKYPFRQPVTTSADSTTGQPPERRLGLDTGQLADLLQRYRLSANIGAEDFGRVLAAAEEEAARRHLSGLTCADVMSRHIISIGPGTRLRDVAAIFADKRFKTLPVVAPDGQLLGLVTQTDLIAAAMAIPASSGKGILHRMAGLLEKNAQNPRAGDIMSSPSSVLAPTDKLGLALEVLQHGTIQTVPVNENGKLAGLISRSDLIAALARLTIMPDLGGLQNKNSTT